MKEKSKICVVATPDHWHPRQTFAAVQAGAHVDREKSFGHTMREGRAMVKAQAAGHLVKEMDIARTILSSPPNRQSLKPPVLLQRVIRTQ